MGDESVILPAKVKAYLEDHLVTSSQLSYCMVHDFYALQASIMEQWEQQGVCKPVVWLYVAIAIVYNVTNHINPLF